MRQVEIGLSQPVATPELDLAPRPGVLRRASLYLRHRSLLAGLIICSAIIILAAGAPLFTHYSPVAQDPNVSFARPTLKHLMGTDEFGRDVFARVLYGGRNTLSASF